MSIAGIAELAAWLLSAVIAGWLLFDVIRVSRRHDEETLVNPGERMEPVIVDGSGRGAAEGSHS